MALGLRHYTLLFGRLSEGTSFIRGAVRFTTGLDVQSKLALLIMLAKRPDGRATLDELRDVLAAAETDEHIRHAEQLYSFDHIDVFETGLAVSENDSLLITDNGRSLLSALGIVTRELPDLDPLATVRSLNVIDDLIGPEAHRRIFEPRSRSDDRQNEDRPLEDAIVPEAQPSEAAGTGDPIDETHAGASRHSPSTQNVDEAPPAPPDFLMPKFGAGHRPEPERSGFPAKMVALMKRWGSAWRGHLQQGQVREITGRANAKAERVLFAFLALLVFVSGACAAVAFMQVRSVRSELAALQRELLPLKERLAKLEQAERSKQPLDRPSSLKERLAGVERPAQPPREPLVLSREEIQIVRDFIKPAPTPGSPVPSIGVGDPVAGPTIPVPPVVVEKVPKLIGARFTIANGAIILVRSGSRNADAVLAQN